ncbi:disulfide bond formation protein B [Oxalobacteraceae bacterium R-40]|uniref:Disulfide bond formation protein B n=1 Tax=Keguizhuia sedimenti TaxID=3064264 RepID=A0ABU1BQ34_9BURK|nr:disulfide bond formation protein B [Oxalobacteraceae bacterium R-40]
MNTKKVVLIAVGLASLGLLSVGLYLQHVENMLPCPLCVIQRYAFAAVALASLIAALLPHSVTRIGAGIAALAALAGASVAGRHLWIKANPATSCGIDPLETSLNTIPTAKLMPFLFKADGLCTTDYPPVFGLSIPLWALIWFAAFALILLWTALRRRK